MNINSLMVGIEMKILQEVLTGEMNIVKNDMQFKVLIGEKFLFHIRKSIYSNGNITMVIDNHVSSEVGFPYNIFLIKNNQHCFNAVDSILKFYRQGDLQLR